MPTVSIADLLSGRMQQQISAPADIPLALCSPTIKRRSPSRQLGREIEGGNSMIRQLLFAVTCTVMLGYVTADQAEAQQAFGRSWGAQNPQSWDRFYHYPYVYYPHNYMNKDHYRSADNMYFRYPQEMRIPVYNRKWHNYYPSARPYHRDWSK